MMRANKSNEQITERVSASNSSARGRKPVGTTMTAQRHNAPRLIPQYNNKRKHIVQYKKGTGTSNNNSIAAKRPSYFDNKCIVISRVDKDTTMSEFQSNINQKAGRNIQFLHKPINLAKDYASWRTIAIELNDNDYELMSNPEFRDSGILLKDYVGRRWWRNQASNLSSTQRQNAMRQQWTSS